MRVLPVHPILRIAAILAMVLLLPTTSAEAGVVGPAPGPVNVLEDCWTTDTEIEPDPELELYTFTTDQAITFVWKQKLLLTCTSYRVTILGWDCVDGKPTAFGNPRAFEFRDIPFGALDPIPGVPEPLFSFTAAPGSIPPGRYDWAMFVECDDTDGRVGPDGDIDDECGINAGLVLGGPLILGPEPIEILDPDPGGSPPGRGPGEEGTTRPWCFEVTPPPGFCDEPFSCGGALTDCEPGCGCFEAAEGGGACSPGGACAALTPCPGGTSDCAGGEVCLVNTCCPGPVCAQGGCDARAPVWSPGLTTTGEIR